MSHRMAPLDEAGKPIPKKKRDKSDQIPGHKLRIYISGLRGVHDVRTGIAYWYRGHYLYALNGGPIEPVEYPTKAKIFVKALPLDAAPPYDPRDPSLVNERDVSAISHTRQNIMDAKPVVGINESEKASSDEADHEEEGDHSSSAEESEFCYEPGYASIESGSVFGKTQLPDSLHHRATPPPTINVEAQLFSPHDRAHYLAESAPVSISGSLAGSRASSPLHHQHVALRSTISLIGLEHMLPESTHRHHRQVSSTSTSSAHKLLDLHSASGLRSVSSASQLQRLLAEEGVKRPRSAHGGAARKSVHLDKIVDEDEPLVPSSVFSNVNLRGLKQRSSVNFSSKVDLRRTASLKHLPVETTPLLRPMSVGPSSTLKSPTRFDLGDDTVETFPLFSRTSSPQVSRANSPQISRATSPKILENIKLAPRPAYPGLSTRTRTRRLSSIRGNHALNEMYNRRHYPHQPEHEIIGLDALKNSEYKIASLGPLEVDDGRPIADGMGIGGKTSPYDSLAKGTIGIGFGSSLMKRTEPFTRPSDIHTGSVISGNDKPTIISRANSSLGNPYSPLNLSTTGYVFGSSLYDGQDHLAHGSSVNKPKSPNVSKSAKKSPAMRPEPKSVLKCPIHGEDCDGKAVLNVHLTQQVCDGRGFKDLYPFVEYGDRKMVDWAMLLSEEKRKMGRK